MSKFTLKILPVLTAAIAAALVTQPVRAGVIDSLVITENSSTSLTATFNGNPLSVTLNFADNWNYCPGWSFRDGPGVGGTGTGRFWLG